MQNKRNLNKRVNKMKRHFFNLFVAAVVVSFAFTACEKKKKKEKDTVIETNDVVNSSSDIATAKAELWDESAKKFYEFSSCGYKNNWFKLSLSATIPDKFLYAIESNHFDFPESVAVSDRKAKMTQKIELCAYNNTGEFIGNFYLRNETEKVQAFYMYADKDFTVKGTDNRHSYPEVYNCSFKKGWNIQYCIERENEDLYTTEKPAATLKWYFYDYRSN
jgi:hypothetical protein